MFAAKERIGGYLISECIFLRANQSQPKKSKKNPNYLKEAAAFLRFASFVDLPFNCSLNERKLFESEKHLAANPISSKLSNHSLSSQHFIFLQSEYVQILHFMICRNLPTPIYLRSAFVSFCDPAQIKVSPSAKRLLFEENAGGCSEYSEAFSFEVLRQFFDAKLVKTEMEILYWSNHCKKTDYLMRMNGQKIGVSVTR